MILPIIYTCGIRRIVVDSLRQPFHLLPTMNGIITPTSSTWAAPRKVMGDDSWASNLVVKLLVLTADCDFRNCWNSQNIPNEDQWSIIIYNILQLCICLYRFLNQRYNSIEHINIVDQRVCSCVCVYVWWCTSMAERTTINVCICADYYRRDMTWTKSMSCHWSSIVCYWSIKQQVYRVTLWQNQGFEGDTVWWTRVPKLKYGCWPKTEQAWTRKIICFQCKTK